MTQEEINKVAQEYAEENAWYPGETSYKSDNMAMEESFANAFKAGALWRINSVWHDTDKELPEIGKHAVSEDWIDFIAEDEKDLKRIIKTYGFKRWAYVSDLLPQKN